MAPLKIGSSSPQSQKTGDLSEALRKRTMPAPKKLADAPDRKPAPFRAMDRFEDSGIRNTVAKIMRDGGTKAEAMATASRLAAVGKELKKDAAQPLTPAQVKQLDATSLSQAEKDKLKAAATDGKDLQAAYDVRRTLDAIKDLSPELQTKVLKNAAAEPTSTQATATAEIVNSPAWKQATPAQREQMVHVLDSAGYDGVNYLNELAQDPARLFSTDSQGHTLLENLDACATQELNAELTEHGYDKAKVMDSLLQECARPEEINQAGYGTCTVTSMQYELVRDNPSEYARLMTGLTGPEGKVKMAGGDELGMQHEWFDDEHIHDDRSITETLFQGAAMEYGNGGDTYNAARDKSEHDGFLWFNDEYGGLDGDQQKRVLEQLFNKDYDNWSGDSGDMLEYLKHVDTHGSEAPVIVSVRLGPDDDPGYHAMTFDHVEDGKVYFRNPWGKGTYAEVEGMTLEDPNTGLYSMTEEQFKDRVTNVNTPSDLKDGGGNTTPDAVASRYLVPGEEGYGVEAGGKLGPKLGSALAEALSQAKQSGMGDAMDPSTRLKLNRLSFLVG